MRNRKAIKEAHEEKLVGYLSFLRANVLRGLDIDKWLGSGQPHERTLKKIAYRQVKEERRNEQGPVGAGA
jgi:hypothetical protein